MKYARLGESGLTVSRLALGCMTYGDPGWRPWVLGRDAALPFYRRALEAGINFFDTADMYSLGVSEEITGHALREYGRREELVVATKVYWPMAEGPNRRGLSRKHIVQACEASLRRLGMETIDLYQIHRFDSETPIDETLAALEQLVQHGKVRYIGASSGYAWQMARALSTSERRGWARFISMQNHYNLLYREEEREMIPLCIAEGVGVIPWSPLARGLLTRPRTEEHEARSARAATDTVAHTMYGGQVDWEIVDDVHHLAAARGVSPAQIALAWLLSRPGVTAPIVGATALPQLDEAVAALELVLDADECAHLERHYRPHGVIGHS